MHARVIINPSNILYLVYLNSFLRIDNSEYMRNGDYAPNRFGAQTDAVTVVFSHKVDSNPENTAGVMTMAGKRQVTFHVDAITVS
jgi:hypothetical protein